MSADVVRRTINAAAQAIANENPYNLPMEIGPEPTPDEIRLAEVAVRAAVRELLNTAFPTVEGDVASRSQRLAWHLSRIESYLLGR